MKRILALVSCCFFLLASTRPALHAQDYSQYVRPVPGCGHYGYDGNNALFISNTCNIDITLAFSSAGEVWGSTSLGPGATQYTGFGHRDVDRSGGSVDVFSCPGNSTPEQLDGTPIMGHYRGEYRCHR